MGTPTVRLTGHCVIWLLHQNCLLASETEFGSIWYWLCADANESRALEAIAAAVKVFIVCIMWFGIEMGRRIISM